MNAKSDSSVVDGGFTSPEQAREFADWLVSTCVTSKRLVQEVIADALIEVQQAVERKYRNSIAIPEGWRLAVLEGISYRK